ncbi:2-phosphosulfolactate phosphatase [Litchfieldia alkalitelluris]|uniref:2-phosphosulfolactate phosphatase n=1 Tax=Litchfieldia alkalitelluris TaxID=304268 RepID=UPI00099778E1|nr:2-phosphosulfolactate phosphatase [Litchfieldia alkalitelluris]
MPKVHLLMKKEEIDEQKIKEQKIAVVFDVLLATSTITTCLSYGAKEVIPVINKEAAIREAKNLQTDSYILVGEYEGRTIEGFFDPNPLSLKYAVKNKTVILSTTNGTVAVNRSRLAEKVYICSLLNGSAIATKVNQCHQEETIVIVCSGSSGEFCLEDFYEAGYFLDCLLNEGTSTKWELTDSAIAAHLFYSQSSDKAEEILRSSFVGKLLVKYGYRDELEFVASRGILDIVPYLNDRNSIVEGDINGYVTNEK